MKKKQQKKQEEIEQVKAPNAKVKGKAKAKYSPKTKNSPTNPTKTEVEEVPRNAGSLSIKQQDLEVPFVLKTIDFSVAEEDLRRATMGADHTWADKTPQENSPDTLVAIDSDCEDEGEDYLVTREKLLHINKHNFKSSILPNARGVGTFF